MHATDNYNLQRVRSVAAVPDHWSLATETRITPKTVQWMRCLFAMVHSLSGEMRATALLQRACLQLSPRPVREGATPCSRKPGFPRKPSRTPAFHLSTRHCRPMHAGANRRQLQRTLCLFTVCRVTKRQMWTSATTESCKSLLKSRWTWARRRRSRTSPRPPHKLDHKRFVTGSCCRVAEHLAQTLRPEPCSLAAAEHHARGPWPDGPAKRLSFAAACC